MKWMNSFFKKNKGQGMVEYGLILALISVVAIVALGTLGTNINTKFEETAAKMDGDPPYTITFDANGGELGTPATAEVGTKGGNVTLPTAPTLENSTFVGWFTAKTGGTPVDGTTPINRSMTLYARWS